MKRALQLASRNPIRHGPHEQHDKNANRNKIGDLHPEPAYTLLPTPTAQCDTDHEMARRIAANIAKLPELLGAQTDSGTAAE